MTDSIGLRGVLSPPLFDRDWFRVRSAPICHSRRSRRGLTVAAASDSAWCRSGTLGSARGPAGSLPAPIESEAESEVIDLPPPCLPGVLSTDESSFGAFKA
ncbi:hypothetical protein OPV22_021319 [Ensete ventricosum]|uniref:Uncharacterized protein n=1 Tax=Ensete ventricosum TaxID=4639 RepID=A0AAV8QQB8_ENSVE|nr:hypothetical protein OPV22_021319 [Ensete ventricosum]